VLVWTDGTGEELDVQKARPGEAPGEAASKAHKFRKFLDKELGEELELRVLEDLYGSRQGLFLARLEGKHHSALLYILNPRGAAPGFGAGEESALFNADHEQGGWWYLAHLQSELTSGDEVRHEPRGGFEALGYSLDTTIDKKERLHSK